MKLEKAWFVCYLALPYTNSHILGVWTEILSQSPLPGEHGRRRRLCSRDSEPWVPSSPPLPRAAGQSAGSALPTVTPMCMALGTSCRLVLIQLAWAEMLRDCLMVSACWMGTKRVASNVQLLQGVAAGRNVSRGQVVKRCEATDGMYSPEEFKALEKHLLK